MDREQGTSARWKRRPEGANWGEFGSEDQLGRMNLVTSEARMEGVREIRSGRAFNLSLPLDYPGGSVLHPQRGAPLFSFAERGDGFNYNYRLSASCDEIASGAIDALRHSLGKRVPEDVRVCGFDDHPVASLASYQISTFRQPP